MQMPCLRKVWLARNQYHSVDTGYRALIFFPVICYDHFESCENREGGRLSTDCCRNITAAYAYKNQPLKCIGCWEQKTC